MSASALALVLEGAMCHALWNMVAKKASGGLGFVWLFGVVSVVAAALLALWAWSIHAQTCTPRDVVRCAGSGVIYVLYALVLQRGYKAGDFAVVYSIARGTVPMLSVLAAIAFWGAMPSAMGWLGVAAVVAGVFVSAGAVNLLRGNPTRQRNKGALWGILTGMFIATYTLIDGWAITALGMQPDLFYSVGLLLRYPASCTFCAPSICRFARPVTYPPPGHHPSRCAVALGLPAGFCRRVRPPL